MSDNLRTRYKKKLEAILGESKQTTFSEMLRGNLIQIFFKVGKGYINFLVPVERHGIQGQLTISWSHAHLVTIFLPLLNKSSKRNSSSNHWVSYAKTRDVDCRQVNL
jgi:hypothetical protein